MVFPPAYRPSAVAAAQPARGPGAGGGGLNVSNMRVSACRLHAAGTPDARTVLQFLQGRTCWLPLHPCFCSQATLVALLTSCSSRGSACLAALRPPQAPPARQWACTECRGTLGHLEGPGWQQQSMGGCGWVAWGMDVEKRRRHSPASLPPRHALHGSMDKSRRETALAGPPDTCPASRLRAEPPPALWATPGPPISAVLPPSFKLSCEPCASSSGWLGIVALACC